MRGRQTGPAGEAALMHAGEAASMHAGEHWQEAF